MIENHGDGHKSRKKRESQCVEGEEKAEQTAEVVEGLPPCYCFNAWSDVTMYDKHWLHARWL